MREDIPDDIMQTARALAMTYDLYIKTANFRMKLPLVAVEALTELFAAGMMAERKKWDGASTFKRCMEK